MFEGIIHRSDGNAVVNKIVIKTSNIQCHTACPVLLLTPSLGTDCHMTEEMYLQSL